MKILFPLALWLLACTTSACGAPRTKDADVNPPALVSGVGGAQEATSPPSFTQGDTFVVKISREVQTRGEIGPTVEFVIGEENGLLVFKSQPNAKSGLEGGAYTYRFTTDLCQVSAQSPFATVKTTPDDSSFKWPLRVGAAWAGRYEWQRLGGSGSEAYKTTVRAKVARFESVTVPAGTFQAFRIELESNARDYRNNRIIWYVPGPVSFPVKMWSSDPLDSRNYELVSYSRKADNGR